MQRLNKRANTHTHTQNKTKQNKNTRMEKKLLPDIKRSSKEKAKKKCFGHHTYVLGCSVG